MEEIRSGDVILLLPLKGGSGFLVHISGDMERIPGGALDTSEFIGMHYGDRYMGVDGKEYILLRPSQADMVRGIKRRAQIITPKDGMYIIGECGITPGTTVVESGVGSGGFTILALNAVGPSGRVISIDINDEFLAVARKNIHLCGLEDSWTYIKADVYSTLTRDDTGLAEGADVFVLDLPEPWKALATVENILKPGGSLAVYVPTYNQLQRVWEVLSDSGRWTAIKAVENVQREIEMVSYGGGRALRPANVRVGFTAFILTARFVP